MPMYPFNLTHRQRAAGAAMMVRRPASSVVEVLPRPGQLPVGAVRLFKSRPATKATTPIGAYVGGWLSHTSRSYAGLN